MQRAPAWSWLGLWLMAGACTESPLGERRPADDHLCAPAGLAYSPRDIEAAKAAGCGPVFAMGVWVDPATGERYPDEKSAFCCPK